MRLTGREPDSGGRAGLSGLRSVRNHSVGRNGGSTAYANNRHRYIIDAKIHQCLRMEAHRISLAIFGSFDDPLCDELTHSLNTSEVPK